MTDVFKYFLFLFLVAAFFLQPYYLPPMEKYFGWQAATLSGEGVKENKPIFFPKMWLNRRYQKQYEAYLKDQSPVRDLLIRTRNQVEYDFLSTIGNQTVLMGKDEMLFSKKYVDAVFQKHSKSEKWIKEKVAKLRVVIDFLDKKGVQVLVLAPPSKARIYPKKLPSNYQIDKVPITNRSLYLSAFEDYQVPLIDFDYFIDYEAKEGLPVYPQAGLHWNYLGVALAADTIQHYLTTQYDLRLPELIWSEKIPLHTDFEDTDTELLRSINLLKKVALRPAPYPSIEYSSMRDSLKPKAIVIGDSYYQILLKKGYHEALFQSGSPYWHYFGAEAFKAKDSLKKFKRNNHRVMEELESSDVIILSVSEANLTKFGFGFIDFVYEEITKTENK